MAQLWAKWLRHPCHLGDPQRCRAGGEITSGPLVGNVATSPLPSLGSPPLQSWGQNQKCPTSGQSGSVTPAVSGIPTASDRGEKSEVAQLWAKWLRHPCPLGDPQHRRAGSKIGSGPLVGNVATLPLPSWGSPPHQSGGEIRSGPLVSKLATSPLPSRGFPPLQSGGQNQKWPTSGQSGQSHLCRLVDPQRCRAGENQKWPTCGQSGYVTLAISRIPSAAELGAKSQVAHLWATATSPLPSRGSPALQSGGQHENIKNTKKAKEKILQAAGFQSSSSEISAQCYYQLSYARIC